MSIIKALFIALINLTIAVILTLWIYGQGDIVHTVAAGVITNPTVEALTFATRDPSYAVFWGYGDFSFNSTWFGITLCLIVPLCVFLASFSVLRNRPMKQDQ